jgi:hypothetical protein
VSGEDSDVVSARNLVVLVAAAMLPAVSTSAGTIQPRTVKAWDAYVAASEARIDNELGSTRGFLVSDFAPGGADLRARLLRGEVVISEMTTSAGGRTLEVPDALVSHWRGSIFLPGLTLDTLLHRLQYPPERGPLPQDVLALRVLERKPDALTLFIRMTRTKIVTVTYDTEHDVTYRHYGAQRASSRSVATRIVEIDEADTSAERARPSGTDHGFMWRLNAYWRYEQVPGGVIVELESMTLSRAVPFGLTAVLRPIIDRVARESIGRTLDGIRQLYGAAAP